TRYCPYVEALPSILKTALPHLGENRIIAPILDFRLPLRVNAQEIVRAFRLHVPLDPEKVEKALASAEKARLAH
ncbi:MAG: hypothetical protein H6P98_2182, partial [Candidatus Aminicenantes bacterium]|nr:hypothetical protein [Candidatus Aminicenantes bacterium]